MLKTTFAEAYDNGEPRLHYRALMERLHSLAPGDLQGRARLVESTFRTLGITFAVSGREEGLERTWPMDLVPRIIPGSEWEIIEAGLKQRVRALNLFLDDLYVGAQAALHDGVIPRWVVESADGYLREAHGLRAPQGAHCVVAGIDLIRDGGGVYRVLEDNLRVPSGVSYVLENRVAMTRALPIAFRNHAVRPVSHYGASLLTALRSIAPTASGDPTVVVLTPGIANSAYFEHAFLARQMGVELVEGRDLVVQDQVLFMRTTRGLARVDVVYSRVGDEFLDPVVFRHDSLLGIPGIVSAYRAGNVTIANAIGNGAADDKAVYAYVPDMIRYFLAEEPILPNVTTYLPWQNEDREQIFDRLEELVVKPVAEAGGYGIVIGSQADRATLEDLRAKLTAQPRGYIAQETIQLSTHPTLIDASLEERHIDLRPFVLTGEDIEVIPGGLTRVALPEGSLIVNSSQGGGSKDTWVLEDDGAVATR
ncbi:MAG: circularly permuted type 2 ATP-grasp protein [Acidimicrobiia bacterium]|nr:circularly permuted type 2 ATP-grasp protein [Acidimicrobiia bacterium]NNL70465.1 circularly permuted type 2 ATP-grasp protein [Acidimicrobiia bacterium]